MNHNVVIKGVIYKAKRGHVYNGDNPQYNCFIPAETGVWRIVDCWPCDAAGNIHPGYNASPVPVDVSNLGQIVGDTRDEE